ncbi:MAG: cytochrome P450 [Paracoccaceae bacterium]|nr:cytochrome P450 [Paracoccaceae bacterium]
MMPPKPAPRSDKVSLWRYMRLFRQDLLSAQPARLYRAWMAEFRTPFFRSFMINQPELIDLVLKERPMDFPKSERISEGLRPLLGQSVFVTNGEVWQRQRRIIDPAFEGGRLKATYSAMYDAARAAVARMPGGDKIEIEELCSHAAADVIFRTLFSIPIEHDIARDVFHAFKDHQRAQPILNLAAFVPLPKWMPRFHSKKTRLTAAKIRSLIAQLVDERRLAIKDGSAPDDLATKIMTTPDPETGKLFEVDEMVDQVAIFFLAGHETSASALAWSLYLLATNPSWQDRVADEAVPLDLSTFSAATKLVTSRDVFRETLRLYPPVPMMVRQSSQDECLRDRVVPKGAQIVVSPWHLHRHERLWDNPDGFDPSRWQTENGKDCARKAYIPFSTGKRVCPGAGFAMIEGPLLMAMLVEEFTFEPIAGREPLPVAHLTVRAKDGIFLSVKRRNRPSI